jgi:hypothetical protein
MKKILLLFPLFFIFCSCNKLSNGKAEELINQKHSYPQAVELDFIYDYIVPISGNIAGLPDYPGMQVSDKDAQLVAEFAKKGLVTISDKIMTGQDAGYNVIKWHHYKATLTDEGKKYSTGVDETETNSGKNIYKVKLYDEQIGQIIGIDNQESGKPVDVHYTTIRANATPFLKVYQLVYGSTGIYDTTKVEQDKETFMKSGISWNIE